MARHVITIARDKTEPRDHAVLLTKTVLSSLAKAIHSSLLKTVPPPCGID